jgi:ferredoxin
MNVLPRKQKRDISCVNCGACITACNHELGEGKGLFHLGFGKTCAAPSENCGNLEAGKPLAHTARLFSGQ